MKDTPGLDRTLFSYHTESRLTGASDAAKAIFGSSNLSVRADNSATVVQR